MDIILYNTSDDPRVVNKTITQVASLQGSLRNETEIVTPVVLIEYANPAAFNYAYISAFGRYYFVTDVKSVRNGILEIHLKSDVLKSFGLSGITGILSESQSVVNNYLPSRGFVRNCKTKTDIIQFPNGLLNNGEYILITAGGML